MESKHWNDTKKWKISQVATELYWKILVEGAQLIIYPLTDLPYRPRLRLLPGRLKQFSNTRSYT